MKTSAQNEMTAVPAGQVTLSDRRTERRWQVDLTAYEIGTFPVTRALYAQAGDAQAAYAPPGVATEAERPVDGVS